MSSRTCSRLAVSTVMTAGALLAMAAQVGAQVPDPAPDSSLPGGGLIAQMLGWLKYLAIASSVAGLLIGGISLGVGHFGSSYGASAAGRKWILGGIGAAMIAGLAHTITTTVYNAT